MVFADAGYWIALLNPRDTLNAMAKRASAKLAPTRIITSEMVLAEVLDVLGDRGAQFRDLAARTVDQLRTDPNVTVVPQTSTQFRSAMERYRNRPDKEWGLTDCASFLIMEERGLSEALTHDHHFEQAGFTALLRQPAP